MSNLYNRKKAQRALSSIENDIGKKYGKLTVVSYGGKLRGKHHVIVICECGITASKNYNYVKTGHTSSCGCLWLTTIRDKVSTRKGASSDPLWHVFKGMIDRCNNENNPSYHRYGGRGINVCKEWEADFFSFKKYVGERPTPKHTLDRIDNDGNYEPGNVRWATRKQQTNNSSVMKKYPYKNGKYSIVDIAHDLDLSTSGLYWRIKNWGYERAISTERGNL